MTVAVAVSSDGIRLPLSRSRVADIARAALRAERVNDALVSIAFVSTRAIAKLNRRYLGHTGPTDVISFAFEKPLVGDIYIAPEVAKRNAMRFGVGIREELTRLVIHGVLHVVGHDHPDDARSASPMWKLQERLVRRALSA